MDRHLKDPVAYSKDYQNFIQNLQKFHGSRGTGFKRVPFFGGKELDLFLLYKTVTSLGGFVKVTEEKKWREAAKCFNLPVSCTNAAFSLRQYYLRYLASYERYNFFGEDVDEAMAEMRKSSIAGSMQNSSINFGSFSNMNQSADNPAPVKPGPLGEPRVNNFDRLVFSLKSGLPNEVDFALNICTLLSNVTNSIFNLAKAPNIVDLLLAHVGIFTEGSSSMRELYKEWYQESDRDFVKFWRDSIDDQVLKEIFKTSFGMTKDVSDENEMLVSSSSLFSRDTSVISSVEANRALQVCVILHNFSYEGLNCLFVAEHKAAKRFLFMCAGTHLGSLRKCALDTLDNLADVMTLPVVQDIETQNYLRALHSFLFSKDRARKVRAISIFAKLAAQHENEDVLSDALSSDVYDELVRCLSLPDIQLILNALDALYYLSDLGEATATAIVTVYRSIDILVCLVKVHAESYGNRAIAGFRITENKNSIHAQKHAAAHQQTQRNAPARVPPTLPANSPAQVTQLHTNHVVRSSPKVPSQPSTLVRHEQEKTEETDEIEPEIFAARWISAFYELAPGFEIRRSKVFSDYTESCKELGRKAVLSVHNFFKILGLVVPGQYWKQSETDKDDLLITGIKQRAQPLYLKNRNLKAVSRGPDVSSSQPEQSTHPMRPIPNTPIQVPHVKIAASNSATVAQSSVPMPQGMNPQQMVLQHPGMVQMQMQAGIRQPTATAVVAATTATDASKQTQKQADATTQKMPLQLLQQHVNAQGNTTANATPHAATQSISQEQAKQIIFQQVAPNSTNQPLTGNQKFMPVQLVQPQFIQQLQLTGQPSQTVIHPGTGGGNAAQAASQQAPPVTTILNGPIVQLTDGQSSLGQNVVVDVKLSASQKQGVSAKDKNERKKAIKVARDIINADICASNQDPLTQCQSLTDKIQKEMQQHFLQFHVHQQSIQAIQSQLQQVVLQSQQSKLPQNVMDDVQTRVRSHHAQMQVHYQKLQQLQLLLQQVQLRHTQEQKSTGVTVNAETSTQRDADKSNAQRNFNPPRILKPQSTGNSTVDASKMPQVDLNTQTNALAMTSAPPVNGLANAVNISSSASSVPTILASVNSIPLNSASNMIMANNPQLTEPLASNQPVMNKPILLNTPTSKQMMSSTATSSVTAAHGVSNLRQAPVQLLASQSSTAMPLLFTNANPQVTSLLTQSGFASPSGKQFIQVPLVTAVQPSIGAQNAKAASLTQNTPILPRPQQTSITVSNATALQSLQKSALPGQRLLLTVPIPSLSSQQTFVPVMPDSQALSADNSQSAVLKQTGQSVTVRPSGHIVLHSSPTMQNKADATSSQTSQSFDVSKSHQTSTSRTSVSSTLSNGPSINQTQIQNSTIQTILPVKASPLSKVSSVLANGGFGKEQQQSIASSHESLNKVTQNGTQHCDTILQADVSIGNSVKGGALVDSLVMVNSNVTSSKLPGHGVVSTTLVSSTVALTTQQVVTTANRNNEFECAGNNKRNIEQVLDASLIVEKKRQKLDALQNVGSSDDRSIKVDCNAKEVLHDRDNVAKNEMTRQRINGAFTNITQDVDMSNRFDYIQHGSSSNTSTSSNDNSNSSQVECNDVINGSKAKVDSNATSESDLIGRTNEPCSGSTDVKGPNLDREHASSGLNPGMCEGNMKSDCKHLSDTSEVSSRKTKRHDDSKRKQKAGRNCLWSGCGSCFSRENDLLAHMVLAHAPTEGHTKACKVPGCKSTKRPRGSMICHFKQAHCKSHSSQIGDDHQVTLPELLFPKVLDMEREDESPVTRSVRLTAALILRNIARNSAMGRQLIKGHESKLVVAAMSSSEASNAIAACLEELTRKRRTPSDSLHDGEAGS